MEICVPRRSLRTRTFNGKTCPLDFLTDSEREILKLLGIGKSGSEIACRLRLSERSLAVARGQLIGKLNLRDAHELFRYAVCWVKSGGG